MPIDKRARPRRSKTGKLSYFNPPGGYSSSEGEDYPESPRIADATPFNLPHSSPDNSDESSDGWSDSEGISSGEEKEAAPDQNGLQDIESSILYPTRDGLLLVSDDENFVDNGDDYLSDSALSLNAFRKPTLQTYDETKPESYIVEFEIIPSCVALRDIRYEADQDIDDLGRNYDARYDGNLQDLMKSEQPGVVINDEDDDSDSSTEFSGYLSTGETRCRDLLLIPYVGERPPTPPSPSRTLISQKLYSDPQSSKVRPSRSEPPTLLMIYDSDDEGAYEHCDQSAVEQICEQDTYCISLEAYERDCGVPYGDHGRIEVLHDYVDVAQYPAISRVTSKDDESAIVVALTKARTKDRRLIRILTLSLGCALISLAAVIGGVVALKFIW
jgi:hypothetical protein